ncbi:hypothetical protein [Winogradskyella sp.]|uniref:hypothetical protein n=1 Tax=Winogradskyella sp. TaxID=1883156 RepID=UPI00262F6801|nr:hypothetical protein [Winogradskyella sp.]
MTTNILEHLENIKIYTDYINSGLDTIEMFWEEIDKGNFTLRESVKTTKFEVNNRDFQPSETELKELEQERERKVNIDFSEEYIRGIRNKIETALDYDQAIIPSAIELQDIFENIIQENGNLNEYLSTSHEVFNRYANIIGNDLPKHFFRKLSQIEVNEPIKGITDKINHIHKNDFSVFEWATIFHYANEKNLLEPFNTKKEAWGNFMVIHKIDTTLNSFKTNYYSVKRRLYKRQDYPIAKFEKIIPFIEKNYQKALTSLISDKNILEEEQAE